MTRFRTRLLAALALAAAAVLVAVPGPRPPEAHAAAYLAGVVTDGQLGTGSATVIGGQVAAGQTAVVTLTNTSASLTETILVTVARNGGTARRVARIVQAPNEQSVLTVHLDQADVLSASTTDATTVDYTASVVPGVMPQSVVNFDSAGALKQVNSGISGNQTYGANLAVTGDFQPTTLTAAAGGSTAAAGTTTTDAGVLPAATAAVYPTTAADDTKGVRVHASDKVTGRTLFIGNGVSNKIIKVYGPSGAVINGAAGDAAFSSVSGKGVIITCLSGAGNSWLAW